MKKEPLIGGISENELLQEMDSLEIHGGLTSGTEDTDIYCKGAYCGNCDPQCSCPPPSRPVDSTSQCYWV